MPVRRSRWVSFWVGAGTAAVSLLTAAALTGLLLLLPPFIDGAWVVFAFAVILFGLFFLSLPWQKSYSRSFDLRRPGARLDGGLLTVAEDDDAAICFDLNAPHELTYGWFEVINRGGGSGPTTNTRGVLTYAILSQAGQELFLQAEDSVREAQSAGWPNRTSANTPRRSVRLWASDLVTLVEAVRLRVAAAPTEVQTDVPTSDTDAPEERIREWPGNPLPARNRHEVSLFLEWMKVELISRAPTGGGEVCVGRIRGADPSAAPDTYRLVFTLLEADPEDENDFGSGASKIFSPAELMLLLSRMEREGVFAAGAKDVRNGPGLLLTYKTTREIEALRRANARGIALIEQLMRFAGSDGNISEDSLGSSATRTWFRRSPERFDANSLKAKRQMLRENLDLLQLPITETESARRQAALVRELRERCPEYLDELGRAGFEGDHVLHPWFSHGHHLSRFAARALLEEKPETARAAFAAWAAAEPTDVLFPTREFADAAYELNLEPEKAAPLIPEINRHAFFTYYQARVDPGYNPWSY
ncbi:MAG TPA: hypothetical protein VGX48_08345 [Pyrinomonadaceae bacterium]|nr:hypothetical protein [Pyrinomonadaceae bacterium]